MLRGLQYIYINSQFQKAVFEILETVIPPFISKNNGRAGMALWTILIMGILKLNLEEGLRLLSIIMIIGC